jgi:uncharacterized protein YmfQ (DUF2313 family)
MPYGGYHPYPRRFGGGKPHLEVMHESLNAQRGSAFDPVSTSLVWLETMAMARAIVFDGWGTNQRLANQWDPRSTTDMLTRWETIFRILPAPDTTEAERRAELTRRWQRFGHMANHVKMLTELSARLGTFFVAIEYISLANAVVHVPDGTYPWGVFTAGIGWMSSVAHILVLLQKPAGATEGQFYEQAAKVPQILDAIAPAWTTFDWYRSPVSTPIAVTGGPSMGGFYLDDDHNLDNNTFDV